MRAMFVLMLAGVMAGCTVAQSVNYGVSRYCALPADVRDANRTLVAAAVAPNRIVVECF